MVDTHFYVPTSQRQRLVAVYASDTLNHVSRAPEGARGQGHYVDGPRRSFAGGAGIVSTARDYARFLQMLLNGGLLDGKRLLGPKTVAYMTADHLSPAIATTPLYLPGPGFGFGLGFAVRRDAGVSPVAGTVGEYNWGGAGGTYFWVDPREDLFVVFMMQSPKQRVPYRAVLKDMIYAAITRSAVK